MRKCCWGELLVVALNNAEQNAPAHSQERRTTALALFASLKALCGLLTAHRCCTSDRP